MAGGLFEKRTRGTATTEVHHIQVQGRAVAVYTSLSSTTQSIRYLHGDHLGSIVLVTDEDGEVEGNRYSFDAFGRRRNGANWTDTLTTLTNPDTTRGYTGHEMLDTVDIVHMNGRVYDPFLGRVLSPDPFVQVPFDMQSFNRYSYVFNNPLSLTDPSGFLAEDDWYVFDDGEWISWEVTASDEFGEYTTRGSTYVPNWVYEPAFSNRGGNGGGGSYGAGGWTDGAANSQQRNSGAQPTTRQERNTQSTRPDDRSDADLDVDGAQDQVKADLNLQDQGTIVAASAAAGLGAGMVYGMTSATGVAVLDLTIAYGLIGSQLGIVAGIGILLWYSIDFDARDSEEYTLNPYEQILMQP